MREQNVNKKSIVAVVTPIISARLPRLSQAVADQARARLVSEVVALATGVPADEIRAATRCNARAARARQLAMYLAYVAWRWPLVRVGTAFCRDRTTVAHACRMIEDMRDDDTFDARLEGLELCLRHAPCLRDVRLLAPDLSVMPELSEERLPALS